MHVTLSTHAHPQATFFSCVTNYSALLKREDKAKCDAASLRSGTYISVRLLDRWRSPTGQPAHDRRKHNNTRSKD